MHDQARRQLPSLQGLILTALTLPALSLSAVSAEGAVLETEALRVALDARGQLVSLVDRAGGVEYAAADQESALLRVRMNGQFRLPESMTWDADTQRITLHYGPVRAEIQTWVKPLYLVWELVAVEPLAAVDRVQWGPLATTIGGVVGETIGVVRNDDFALGLQVLNAKTLGGPSLNEEGRDISRGMTALPTPWGSTLQAYSIDRSRPRQISVWGEHFPNMPVPPIPGETVLGSRIALFGCRADQALARIGEVGVSEGLPHPVFDGGVWSRMNPEMGRSYLIIEYTESTIEEILDYAERGFLHSVYHGHPFRTWGHYELRADHFPRGLEGMRACVEAARQRGLILGVHTLSNFISTADPYITPVPDLRLAKTGSSTLLADLDATQTEIEVADPEYFQNQNANWLRTVMIGQELVRYGAVSAEAPWKLLQCQRGAWGTHATHHAAGAEVAKLLDHPYRVFFPNYDMQHEIAIRLAEFINQTGIGHLDFDGHEGCWATGQGTFAEEMFALVFFQHLKRPVHNGSSGVRPFYWRINSNANWGEPWYGGFRESQADYRFNNQALFERNFMPNMMGWFLMTTDTTRADIEWLMARNAGYHAGFALTADLRTLRQHPLTGELLDTIRRWETLRMADAFTAEQRARLRDTAREFRLEAEPDGNYRLYSFDRSPLYQHERRRLQPGEPTTVSWDFANPLRTQPLQFTLSVQGTEGLVRDLSLEIDRHLQWELPVEVKPGQTLVSDGSQTLRLYGPDGRLAQTTRLPSPAPSLPVGHRTIVFDCQFEGDPSPQVSVRFRALGSYEIIQRPAAGP